MSTRAPPPINIMLAVDGSAHARAAIELLCDLPLPAGSTITALAVVLPRQAQVTAWAMSDALQQAGSALAERGFALSTELLSGIPAEELIQYATQAEPDLIVMGAKGLRATLGILLGGVAQQMVEYACCPVLIVRSPYQGLQRLLFTNDGSPFSRAAEDFLARFPLPPELQIQVLHILPPIPSLEFLTGSWPAGTEMAPPVLTQAEEENLHRQAEMEQQAGNLLLQESAARLADQGIAAMQVLGRGDAATEILQHIHTHKIQLAVMGCRGLSQIQGLLLGSVSRKIVHSPCTPIPGRAFPRKGPSRDGGLWFRPGIGPAGEKLGPFQAGVVA